MLAYNALAPDSPMRKNPINTPEKAPSASFIGTLTATACSPTGASSAVMFETVIRGDTICDRKYSRLDQSAP